MTEPNPPTPPIPHWPGELVSLGDYQVFVRTVPDQTVPGQVSGLEPALFVHGLEGSSRNWTDLMDLLRPRLAVSAIDLPGFGDSRPRPDGRYSIAALAQTVIALIERTQIERTQIERTQIERTQIERTQIERTQIQRTQIQRSAGGPVHLLGNSLGGAVCVRVAATRPDLIRTLTLISPALPDSHLRLDLLRFPLASVPGVGARLLRQMQHLPAERRVADVIANCFSDPGRFPPERLAAETVELIRRDALDYPAAALVGSIRTLSAETLRRGRRSAWRDAARISAPTLVIYGTDDRLVNARMAGKAARAFTHARIVVMPSTGHVAHMEHPAQVAAEIGVLLAAASSTGQTGHASQAGPAGQEDRAREFPVASAG